MPLSKLEKALADFRSITDRDLKAELLLEYAQRFQPVPERIARRPFAAEHRVPACESEAYVWSEQVDGGLKYYFAVENPQGVSAKALAVLLDETLSGESAEHIKALDENLVYELFGRGISMGKSQGLMAMIRMVRSFSIILSS